MRGVEHLVSPPKDLDFKGRNVDVRRLKAPPKDHASLPCLALDDPAFESVSFGLGMTGDNERVFILKSAKRLYKVNGLCYSYEDHRKGVRGKCLIERVGLTSKYKLHLICWAPANALESHHSGGKPLECPEHLSVQLIDWESAKREKSPDGNVIVYRTSAGVRPTFRFVSRLPEVKAYRYNKETFMLENRHGQPVALVGKRKFHIGHGCLMWCFADSMEPIHSVMLNVPKLAP
jgi:hypothetical protein